MTKRKRKSADVTKLVDTAVVVHSHFVENGKLNKTKLNKKVKELKEQAKRCGYMPKTYPRFLGFDKNRVEVTVVAAYESKE